MKVRVHGQERDTERLSAWAQDYIRLLNMRLKEVQEALSIARGEVEESNVFIQHGMPGVGEGLKRQNLAPNEHVSFAMGEGDWDLLTAYHRQRGDKTFLEIYAPNGVISVLPASSNVIYVRLEDR